MNKILWWTLAGTVLISLIIMIISFIITKIKIQKIKDKYKVFNSGGLENKALKRGEDHGILLWDLRDKSKNPLKDLSMEFAINTVLRNHYKTFSIINFKENYEKETLIQKTKCVENNDKFDFVLINFYNKLIDEIDLIFKKLNKKGIIMIVNAPKKGESKEMMKYLKLVGIRTEHHKVNLGVILIAK